MPIRFRCPQGHRIVVDDRHAGRRGRCPACSHTMRIPTLGDTLQLLVTPANYMPPAANLPHDAPRSVSAPLPTANAAATLALAPPVVPCPEAAQGASTLIDPAGAQEESLPEPVWPALVLDLPSLPHGAGGQVAASRRSPRPTQDAAPLAGLETAVNGARRPSPELPPSATRSQAAQVQVAGSRLPLAEPALGRLVAQRWRGRVNDEAAAVYWLAGAAALAAALGAGPAWPHWRLAGAPGWAQVMLLLAGLQLLYAVWMASLPDWSSVRVATVVFALAASVYACGLALALLGPATRPLAFDLSSVRQAAVGWCAINVLLASLVAFACGRTSVRWRTRWESRHATAAYRIRAA